MPRYRRWNVTAVVGVTLSTPVDSDEEFQPETAMGMLRTELAKVRVADKPLSIGHLIVKED